VPARPDRPLPRRLLALGPGPCAWSSSGPGSSGPRRLARSRCAASRSTSSTPARCQAARRGSARATCSARTRTPARSSSSLSAATAAAPSETLRADAVVLAAGPWSVELAHSAGLELPLEPRKGQLVRLGRGPVSVRHKVFDGGYLAAVAAPEAELQLSTVLET